MADDFESRTEPASPRRREEAREQGRVAFSGEFVGGLLLLAAVVLLDTFGPRLGGGLLDGIGVDLARPPHNLEPSDAAKLLSGLFQRWLMVAGPPLGILALVGFGACIVQIGFQVVPDLLSFKPERLSPAEGMGKIFSIVGIGKGVLAILKVAALGALAWIIIKNRVPGLAQLGQSSVGHAATGAWDMVMQLALWLAGAMFAVGALDYAWQRFRFERALRMTKQEVKEEAKREEGDPQMRGRIRQIQRDTARKRMMTKVPKATVVVTNPVHIAVAIEYQRGKKGAPRVVAKGRGLIAERIRELAVEHGIPVLERAPLARALYRAVKLDQEIPSALYQAVAEVLTVVYTTSQRSEVRR